MVPLPPAVYAWGMGNVPSPHFPEDALRQFQRAVVPGADGLYRMVQAIFDSVLPDHASVLIAGAGGGREIETLGASPSRYRMVGVDPSDEAMAAARATAEACGALARTSLVKGFVHDLPDDAHDAATSLFVMHFVPDDGAKGRYLHAIRDRLRQGGAYVHVDVTFASREAFSRMAPVYALHARLGGLEPDAAARLAERIGAMPVISEEATLALMALCGFRVVAPFYRGLWYTGWWLEAV